MELCLEDGEESARQTRGDRRALQAQRTAGQGTREDEVGVKSFWAFKMGSVGCCVGCRDESLAVGAGSSVKGRASHLWSLGLVMVVEPLGSNLIQDLGQVPSQSPASVYPPVHGDNSSTTS